MALALLVSGDDAFILERSPKNIQAPSASPGISKKTQEKELYPLFLFFFIAQCEGTRNGSQNE